MSTFLTESELETRSRAWQARLAADAGAMVELRRPALCVLDMQNDFLQRNGAMPVWGGPAIVPRLSTLLIAFRAARLPVFFSRHVCLDPAHAAELGVGSHIRNGGGLLREGAFGSQIIEDLRPGAGDHVITKYRYSAFFGSPLEVLLRAAGVQDVVITGVVSNVCCETTAHDAFFRDFGVVFALDGTGGLDEASHVASLATIRQSYGKVVTVEQVRKTIEHHRRSA